MSTPKVIAQAAFRLHEQKLISHDELVHLLQQCVNAAALENGYAETHGLPFPDRSPDNTRGANL